MQYRIVSYRTDLVGIKSVTRVPQSGTELSGPKMVALTPPNCRGLVYIGTVSTPTASYLHGTCSRLTDRLPMATLMVAQGTIPVHWGSDVKQTIPFDTFDDYTFQWCCAVPFRGRVCGALE